MLFYTECTPIVMGMTINFPHPMLSKELAALAVNLSFNSKNIESMIANSGLNYLMDRMTSTKDPLLMKLIRNISLWTYNIQRVM